MNVGFERVYVAVKDPQEAANFFGRVIETPSTMLGKDPCVRLAGDDSASMAGGGPTVVFVKAASEKPEPAHLAFRLAPAKFAAVLFALASENQNFGNDTASPENGQMADTTGGGMGRVFFRVPGEENIMIEFCC